MPRKRCKVAVMSVTGRTACERSSPMKKKAYSSSAVNEVRLESILDGRFGDPVDVGCDIHKEVIWVMLRWGNGDFEKPWRVGTKASHDYAEVFDGVPSQHDAKDAAVVAELVALGKGRDWPFTAGRVW